MDPVDQRPVELDQVGAQAHELLESGVAGAHVVDRDPGAHGTQPRQGGLETSPLGHQLVLGDLDHDVGEVVGQGLPGLRRGQRRLAEVD